MNDETKLAFEAARDTTKQLITLASAIIAVTITFSKDFVHSVEKSDRIFALCSWGAFLASVFFGVWTLMALTGSLAAKPPEGTESATASIYGLNILIPSAMQMLSFMAGLLLVVIFAITSAS